jgi:large subunit ribosomal protein L29
MKAKELKEKSVEDLREQERELAQQLFTLRLYKSTGQLESPAKMRAVKRDLARVLTALRQRELAG